MDWARMSNDRRPADIGCGQQRPGRTFKAGLSLLWQGLEQERLPVGSQKPKLSLAHAEVVRRSELRLGRSEGTARSQPIVTHASGHRRHYISQWHRQADSYLESWNGPYSAQH